MTRTQLLWLFIWIFIFFLIACMWNKLQHYAQAIPSTPSIQEIATNSKMLQKEMYFKVIKVDKKATISGIVASQKSKEQLIDAYGKVFEDVNYDNLLIEENINEKNLLGFFTNAADNFSQFNTGYLAYNHGLLEIDGTATYPIVQQTLEDELSTLSQIKIENKLFIEKDQTIATINNLNAPTIDSKKVTIKTGTDIQDALNKLLENRRVQFLYARDILTSDSKILVDDIINILQENKHTKIIISGHTDSDGTRKNNQKLSQQRAESIKAYMISKDINESRLRAMGYGESKPLVKNNTLKNRRINRRVEFKVIGE